MSDILTFSILVPHDFFSNSDNRLNFGEFSRLFSDATKENQHGLIQPPYVPA